MSIINKENVLRAILLVSIFLAVAVYFFSFYEEDSVFFILVLSLLLFLSFEAYLRLQHNIDRAIKAMKEKDLEFSQKNEYNFGQINNKLDQLSQAAFKNTNQLQESLKQNDAKFDQLNQSILEGTRQVFVMRNDAVFKLLTLKSYIEKEVRALKEGISELKNYKDGKAQNNQLDVVKLFWYKSNNLGDRLSPVIVEHVLGKRVEFSAGGEGSRLLSAGSILSAMKENDIVWGSGLINQTKMKAPNNVTFLAVRGPLTRDMIDADVPEVYGDPAILLPLIYKPNADTKKTHKVGILPHYIDKVLWEEKTLPPDTKFIDIESNWKKVIDEIVSCELIKTSSLHGIIVAEAYGIPVIWEKYSDNILGGEFKFQDYFLGTGRERQRHGQVLPSLLDLDAKQKALINALEKYYGKLHI